MNITHCPNCQNHLSPRVLGCKACDIEIKGPFELNEFSRLDTEMLHFLRVFVHCEGHIRDMERALGISYPTIKSKIAALKKTLGIDEQPAGTSSSSTQPTRETSAPSVEGILNQVESGTLSVDEALRQIRKKSSTK